MERHGDDTMTPTVVGPARLLQDLMDVLLAEYSDRLAPGSIVRCVARCTRTASGIRIEDPGDFAWVVDNLARARLNTRLCLDQVERAPLAPSTVDRDVEQTVHLRGA